MTMTQGLSDMHYYSSGGHAGLEDRSQVIRGISHHRGLVTERSGVVLGHPGRHMCPGRSRIVTVCFCFVGCKKHVIEQIIDQ